MSQRVIFIHGTGVRDETYTAACQLISSRMPNFTVERCYWAGAHGTRLKADGASIPGYLKSGGTSDIKAELQRCQWRELYESPLRELVAMNLSKAPHPLVLVPLPSGRTAAEQLAMDLDSFAPSSSMSAQLKKAGLEPYWDAAYRSVISSSECAALVASATENSIAERRAIARAVVAQACVCASNDVGLVLSGKQRDAVLTYFVDELYATGRGIFGDLLIKQLKGAAKKWFARKSQRRRGAIMDATSPFAADVLAYQSTHGERIRAFIRDRILAKDEPATLIAHSLGGIAAVELLILQPSLPVHRLITVGSQAPLLYELDLLGSLSFGTSLPTNMPPWLNIYDLNDFLSYVGEPLFGQHVQDQEVDNGVPFPESHSAYWSNDKVWDHIMAFIQS